MSKSFSRNIYIEFNGFKIKIRLKRLTKRKFKEVLIEIYFSIFTLS